MALPPIGAVEITLQYANDSNSRKEFNVFGVGDGSDDDVHAIAESVATQWAINIMPVLTNNITFERIRAVKWDGTGADLAWDEKGGIVGNPSTPNVTYLIHKSTGFVGREFQGRIYLPGVDDDATFPGGAVSDSKMTDLADATSDLMTGLDTDGYNMIILHSNPATPVTVVNELIVDSVVATQRRRLR